MFIVKMMRNRTEGYKIMGRYLNAAAAAEAVRAFKVYYSPLDVYYTFDSKAI